MAEQQLPIPVPAEDPKKKTKEKDEEPLKKGAVDGKPGETTKDAEELVSVTTSVCTLYATELRAYSQTRICS